LRQLPAPGQNSIGAGGQNSVGGNRFADLRAARTWAASFVHWYNVEYRHSGIRYVSPAQRHCEQDRTILDARHALYGKARQANPARWSGQTRNWNAIAAVTLNPERDALITAHLNRPDKQPEAA
jgi:putative transposase